MQFLLIFRLFLGWVGLIFLVSCTTLNEENYTVCLPLLEEDRKIVRDRQDYSYNPENFNACRAPARYRNELHEGD